MVSVKTAAPERAGWGQALRGLPAAVGARVRSESFDSLLLTGTTVLLVLIGVVMVFSSTTVSSYENTGDFFGGFARQAVFASIGLTAMLLIARLPRALFERTAWLALGIGCAVQLLVIATPLGVTVAGNRNWIVIGAVQLQPSELLKAILVVWLAMMVSRKEARLHSFRDGLMPILVGAAVPIGLVLGGSDLGTAVIMSAIVFGSLFLVGVPLRLFIVPAVAALSAFVLMALSSSNRLARILSFTAAGSASDYLSDGWQLKQGMFALANGGIFGVGLGRSTAKWSWLPAADNDFIFAVIGEEGGLVGALSVLALFIVLGVALVRIYLKSDNPFGRTAVAGVLVWISAQAVANISVVLGIIPVLGVPLPLVSSGGSALVGTMAAIGVALAVARHNATSAL